MLLGGKIQDILASEWTDRLNIVIPRKLQVQGVPFKTHTYQLHMNPFMHGTMKQLEILKSCSPIPFYDFMHCLKTVRT
jgi:hypothetical protein